MKPLLSIVVPTKDRYFHLKKLIELIDSFQSDDIELVLQDNTADNTDILEFLNSKEYSYIKYDHNSEQIPISLNSDLAIKNSSGEYVCFIGDDDGVTKYIIDCVRWMKKNEVDAVIPTIVSYKWPDFHQLQGINYSGIMNHKEFTGEIKFGDPKQVLHDLMNRGFVDRGNLPLAYHGIVNRESLEKIYEVCNTYFPGASPDIANGVALSLVVKKYANIGFPIIISGASHSHGGGVRKLKNKAANIEDVPFLPKNAKENWEKNIPRVWTGATVWCESAIKALRAMKREDLIDKVDFEYMYAQFTAFHYPLRKLAYNLSSNKVNLFFKSWINIVNRYYNALKRVGYLKITGNIIGQTSYKDVKDINQSVEILQDKFKNLPF